ncbi:MAG: riboflavin kinase, partial [Phycisphaerales bacterium JB041]
PTDELLALTPEAFLEWVIAKHNPRAFVEGADFRFGKDRAGTIETLESLCHPRGIEVHTVAPVAVGLSDNSAVTASSTIVRWLLGRGRARDAWAVLTRPHIIAGTVVRGDRRGRTLGYPTANIDTPNLVPADGVYASLVTLPDGSTAPGALSVGTKPQFGEHARTAEVYLLGRRPEPGASVLPGLPEYGWPISLDLVGWVREQMQFPTLQGLLDQIERDCARVAQIVESVTTAPGTDSAHPHEATA